MQIEIAELSDAELVVRAGLEANRNLHGTAFAGSLFSISALAGWGMIWIALRSRQLDGHIVLGRASIRYSEAVTGEIVCRCAFDWGAQNARLAKLAATGKAVFPLIAAISGRTGALVHFEGDYAVRAERPSAARS